MLASVLLHSTEHKVCQSVGTNIGSGSPGKAKDTWLGTLRPGSKFITQFGIVEVVADDRAIPMGKMTPDINRRFKEFQGFKTRLEAKTIKAQDEVASQLRARRNKINALYEKGTLNKSSTFHAYFGKDPTNLTDADTPQKPLLTTGGPTQEDPYAALASFFPDRIVECILVPDERQRFLSIDVVIPNHVRETAATGKNPTRLFLKRRVLTEAYNPALATYTCVDCGRNFLSLAGMRYHCNGKVCVQNNLKEGEKRMKRQERVEIVREHVMQCLRKPKHDSRERKNRKAPRALYPEVLISLGFELLKQDVNFANGESMPPIHPAPRITRHSEGGDIVQEDDHKLVDPSDLLESLRQEVCKQQREYQLAAADQKHGAMYKEVHKSLGFVRGKLIPRIGAGVRKRKLANQSLAPSTLKVLPPIIDSRALADEILAGRYPSITRYTKDDHFDFCALCKDGGELICCDFCRNAEHLKCIRERFTVKAPEPEDYFVCHKCIQNVNSKRNRAEKRRLEKQQRDDERQQKEALEASRLIPGIQSGMEYPYMADKAREVNELIELLQDSQTRLRQALATSKMNNIRRKAMGCFYTQ